MKREIILVTDGDSIAQKAVEKAALNVGGRCISRSAGNPTPLTGSTIVELIKKAKYDPVLVMVDDIGDPGFGKGEQALKDIMEHSDMEILGVIAVASNTEEIEGIEVDFSINCMCEIVENAVDKNGLETDSKILYGDTVDIINYIQERPLVVGIGDIGKMQGKDRICEGAPVLTKAIKEILNRSDHKKNEE
ncbi:stage V sporulation protein AE [Gottschalkia purinilytica]|uniref:Stage V sporulation protein AE n=1 Tax=Gottschalkia purinilytica TaxID=1503 RepID=A0A0L0WCR4_GOTPU|nr:stage V sporulation protein AE [Gottschalkia purinilytica]KNF09258.1 stage V sporulation protein AE [Gottschalkia purinilytica]